MTTKTIKFNLDFGGFYESVHSYMIENSIANHFDENGEGLEYNDLFDNPNFNEDDIDFHAMQLDYAKQWFDRYYDQIFPHGYFDGIESPAYYNFETDKIVVEISESKVHDIIEASCEDYDIRDFIDEQSQSYDGFYSYYEGFDNVKKNPSVFMNYYTRYLSELHKDQIDYFYEDIWTNVQFKNKEGWASHYEAEEARPMFSSEGGL